MRKVDQPAPRARKDQLVIKELANETLVYDESSHEAHCLNQTAAVVWRNCDGRTSIARMARLLEKEMKGPVSDHVVWFALRQLEDSHLLEEPVVRPIKMAPMSRRELIRTLGVATAVAVPLVTSIVAPTAAQAATCGGSGSPCGAAGNLPCCAGCFCEATCFCP
ncbi:MAG: PqqD family protein [Pyrinomonadaceae bacterium]